MPSTQAYSVDWTVVVAGNNVDRDVVEATITQKEDNPDSCTVQLDTSERPHAIEEEADLQVQLDDGNDLIEFRGRVDAVKDDKTDPLVTIDAREPSGELDDVSAVGRIREDNLFDVLDAIMDTSAGQVRGVAFDPSSLKTNYGTFGGSVIYGDVEISHYGQFGVNNDTFSQQETTGGQGKSAELVIDTYENNTGTRYQATLSGQDSDGNTVDATFDLPPGEDAQDAFGVQKFKLPLAGGNGLWSEVNSVTTDVPTFTSGSNAVVALSGTVKNYVKTDYDFRVEDDQSVRDAVEFIVGYISTLDNANDWSYRVTSPITGTPELVVEPESGTSPDRYVFTEGDNVLRPVANRSLDGVYNMVKVNGAGDVNAWFWAYNGTYYFSYDNPFESGEYPEAVGEEFGSTGAVNDIDQIDLRARSFDAPNVDDVFQASDIGEKALQQLYRTPVSGVAKTTGLHPADPGDEAEVYYPSRGIPAKVVDNVYTVKAVEYQITTDEATTKVDFGITEPKTGDLIQAAAGGGGFAGAVRNDLSSGVQNSLGGSGGGSAFPLVGTVTKVNDDGTFDVQGEDGNTYEGVEIV